MADTTTAAPLIEQSELLLLLDRLARNPKGLVQEATDEQLSVKDGPVNGCEGDEKLTKHSKQALIDAPTETLCTYLKKNDAQVSKVKVTCRAELDKRRMLEEMDATFHEGEEAQDSVDPYSVNGNLEHDVSLGVGLQMPCFRSGKQKGH
jgi:hypothetical protein